MWYTKKKLSEKKIINPYLQTENYDKLKNKLLQNYYKIQFYEENLKDLPSKLQRQYHAILLSNIGGYLRKIFDFSDYVSSEEITEDDFYLSKFQKLIEKLIVYLDINGIIFIMYLFNQKNEVYNDSRFSIYKTIYREKYFSTKEYQLFKFKGMTQIQYDIDQEDAVLVYKRTDNGSFS